MPVPVATRTMDPTQHERARLAGVRRTALAVGGLALLVYVAFILRGVLLA